MRFNRFAMAKKLLGMVCITGVLTGCNSLLTKEHAELTRQGDMNRSLNQVLISWEVRSDVVDFCTEVQKLGNKGTHFSPPIACAVWSSSGNECTIVTGSQTTHAALQQELLNCSGNKFH
ncbi:MAG: hypothetical protein RLZZ464_412 [Pseudomonadota bacterium]|jgi:hypothetical protein